MKFENTFAVDASIDEVYATLLDVERVAPCVPGAEVLEKTIDDEVLEGSGIAFRSRRVALGPNGTLRVEGELDLAGATRPVAFDLTAGDDGRLYGSARIKQTDWGIKPYSALFGTLKVVDEVGVEIDGTLPT